jgi:Fe2+ transport system protein FeoA
MSLVSVKAGCSVRILSVPDGTVRAQFIRLGISEGERVKCLERLPGGTIVLQKNRQQIALGHKLARQVVVLLD